MPGELDPQLAERIVSSAISSLNPTGNKVLCTRRALRDALLAVAQEAHNIGFLAGQKEREHNHPEGRPAWMDVQLDPASLAKHHLHIKPVVLKSLHEAGYTCMGDLRWIPERQLKNLYYVGIKTAGKIVATIRQCERNDESTTERGSPPSDAVSGPGTGVTSR